MLKRINLNLGRLAEWLPTKGNVLFTLLMIGVLVWAQGTGAFPAPAVRTADTPPTSTGTVAYQGRLADTIGDPLTGTYPMVFRLYDSPASGAYPLWEENWTGPNSVKVSDGLFNVMLGSMTSITQSVVTQNDTLWLGITVGTDDEMKPRVQLGGVPYAVQANTVLNNSITTEKIVDGAVTQAKLGSDVTMIPPDGSVTTPKLADNAVTSAKIGAGAVGSSEIADGSVTDADLGLNGTLNLGQDSIGEGEINSDCSELRLTNQGGDLRFRSIEHMFFFIDTDNNSTGAVFKVIHNEERMGSVAETLLTLKEDGTLSIKGSLVQGALIERNLQTLEQIEAEQIEGFSEGDLLCWDEQTEELEVCAEGASILVMAVADKNGKPIIMGAEPIKVLGPAQPGDLLVTSDTPGYAMVWDSSENPPAGIVIAQALEAFDGEQGTIKAMIRKF